MVSWKQKPTVVSSAFDKFEMTPLNEPVAVRLKFRKVGNLQYISHLDLQRVMSRVMQRSGAPIWFTQGFNPHPKMVFAMPLSVGAQSECEYIDIKIDRKITLADLLSRLNAEVTDEMRFLTAYYPKSKFSEIDAVKYVIEIFDKGIKSDVSANVIRLLTESPLNMVKRSKSGEREIDVTEYIKNVTCTATEGKTIKLTVTINGGEGALNPELIVTALRERLGLLPKYPDKGLYTVTRTNLYFADGREFE